MVPVSGSSFGKRQVLCCTVTDNKKCLTLWAGPPSAILNSHEYLPHRAGARMRAGWAAVVAAVMGCGHGSSPDVAVPLPLVVSVHIHGPGKVEASGLPLDCLDGCEASVLPGTVLHLNARANPAANFDGWEGACVGVGACDLTVTRAAEVTARFSASDPCAGIVPASMGAAVSATLPPPGARRFCDAATSDGQGNVAHEVYGMGPTVWQVYAPDGTKMGRLLDAYKIAEQDSGFHAVGYSGFTARSADGTVLAQERGVAGGSSVATWMFPARTGGSIIVSTDSWGCPNGRNGHSAVTVWRFAVSGALTSVVDIGGTGCPASSSDAFVALSDDHDNTFVALNTGCCGSVFGLPPERVIARWVDAEGRPLTPWMDVAAAGNIEVAPLIRRITASRSCVGKGHTRWCRSSVGRPTIRSSCTRRRETTAERSSSPAASGSTSAEMEP